MDILFTTLLSLHFIVHCILFLSIWLTKIRGDWKRDWEKEEKGREEWSIWGHLNICQQILWAQVGISWTSSSSSFWWKLSWHWQELLMRPPSTRNTTSLLKWHQWPASLGLSPSMLTGTGDWALSAVSWCWLLFLMSLPIWKSNNWNLSLSICTPGTTVLFSRQCACSDYGKTRVQGSSHAIFHCTISLHKAPTFPTAHIPQ